MGFDLVVTKFYTLLIIFLAFETIQGSVSSVGAVKTLVFVNGITLYSVHFFYFTNAL